jgi:hypothetical protein
MGEFVLRRLYLLHLFNEHHSRLLFRLFYGRWLDLGFRHLYGCSFGKWLNRLFWCLFWDDLLLLLHCPLGIFVETMVDAVLDNIDELIDIEDEKRRNGLSAVLLLDVVPNVGLQSGEEIGIDCITPEIKDLPNSLAHLLHIQRLQRLALYALHVELVVDLLVDEVAIGLEVDQEALLCLVQLVHIRLYNIMQR